MAQDKLLTALRRVLEVYGRVPNGLIATIARSTVGIDAHQQAYKQLRELCAMADSEEDIDDADALLWKLEGSGWEIHNAELGLEARRGTIRVVDDGDRGYFALLSDDIRYPLAEASHLRPDPLSYEDPNDAWKATAQAALDYIDRLEASIASARGEDKRPTASGSIARAAS